MPWTGSPRTGPGRGAALLATEPEVVARLRVLAELGQIPRHHRPSTHDPTPGPRAGLGTQKNKSSAARPSHSGDDLCDSARRTHAGIMCSPMEVAEGLVWPAWEVVCCRAMMTSLSGLGVLSAQGEC